jgi:hypothetical protein
LSPKAASSQDTVHEDTTQRLPQALQVNARSIATIFGLT